MTDGELENVRGALNTMSAKTRDISDGESEDELVYSRDAGVDEMPVTREKNRTS
jgi:hypothetical protein